MRKPSPALVVSVAALFFSLTGAGLAASHYLITSTSQIAPSVRHSLHGAIGPAGPQGVTGPQGPQGPAGTAHVSLIVGDTTTLPAQSPLETVLTAACPPGNVLEGGGYYSVFDVPGAVVVDSYPDTSDNVWIVHVMNPSGNVVQAQARAICATI